MIRDTAVGVNAPAPYPSLPDLDTRVSVARAARLDAEFRVDVLATSVPAPVALPARDVDRSADLDAAAHAAAANAPAVPTVTCRCDIRQAPRALGRTLSVTSPWSGATLTLSLAAAERAVTDVRARVDAGRGWAGFTKPELAALADAHDRAASAARHVVGRFNAKLASHRRTYRGRLATR